MATILYMRNTQDNGIGATYFDASTTIGASLATGVVNTTASGTDILWSQTAGGSVLQWVSGKLSAGFTLAGLVTIKLWAFESATAANVGGRVRLYHKNGTTGVETVLGGAPWDDGVEMGTTNPPAAALAWTFTPTSTAFSTGDRLVVKFYITNVGTMGGARTATVRYNNSAAGQGDTSVTLTENVTFNENRTGSLAATLDPITLAATGTIETPGMSAWSATNKSAGVTLSNNDRTATVVVTTNDNHSGRSDNAVTGSAKIYIEYTDVNNAGPLFGGVGISKAGMSFTAGQWHGFTANSIGFYPDGSVFCNWNSTGGTIATGYPTWTEGQRPQIAIDRALKKLWIRVNGGAWAPSGDPAAGTGGLDYSAHLGDVDVYLGYTIYETDTDFGIMTGNFGNAAYANSAPSGFTGLTAVTTSTGTASITLDPITVAATGVVPHTATADITLPAITLAGTGNIPSQGTLASTLSAITLAATGTVANQVFTGTLAVTFDPITLAATGNVPSKGTLASTLDAITLVGTGNIPSKGTLAATLADITLTSTVKVFAQGSLSATLADITLVGTGTVGSAPATGTLASTLGDITLVAAGNVLVRGTVAATLGDVTLAATAAALVKGVFAATLGDITTTTNADVIVGGTGNGTFGDITLVATGKVLVAGSFLKTLDPITLAATAVVPIKGTLNVTLDPIVVSASSSPFTAGVLNTILDPITLAATGAVPAQGTLSVTLGEVTTVALGNVVIKGTVDATFDPITVAGVAVAPVQGDGEIVLGEFTLVAEGVIPHTATLNVTFDPITLVALGSAYTPGETVPIELSGTLSPNVVLVGVLVEGQVTMSARVSGTTALGASTAGPVDLEGQVPENPEV
jgi:hypothetical protein